jgi:hypothetical protein
MRDATQGEQYAASWHSAEFFLQKTIAGVCFGRFWQVPRRYALDGVGNAAIDEPHAITAGA